MHYGREGHELTITPSGKGLPTIFDKDILIFCISQLMARKNAGKPIGRRVRFSARDLLIATNRPIGGEHYDRLEDAFKRLVGTTFTTNITHGETHETRVFSMVDSGGFVQVGPQRRLKYCEITLSDWMLDQIEANACMTISNDYFRIRRPLERRIYEIARKHCGQQSDGKSASKSCSKRRAAMPRSSGSGSTCARSSRKIRRPITPSN